MGLVERLRTQVRDATRENKKVPQFYLTQDEVDELRSEVFGKLDPFPFMGEDFGYHFMGIPIKVVRRMGTNG